jgi:hypothetical protein
MKENKFTCYKRKPKSRLLRRWPNRATWHADIDGVPLVNALNDTYYKQQLAARATRRKNGKEMDTEEPIHTEGVPE